MHTNDVVHLDVAPVLGVVCDGGITPYTMQGLLKCGLYQKGIDRNLTGQ